MYSFLVIFQVVVSALLILTILSQEKGAGLSATFGGSGGGEFYRSKRGIDRFLFVVTVVLSILFVGTAIAFIFVE